MEEKFVKRKTWISSAHRGHVTNGMQENTLSAFMLAAEMGADMIETDARMTKDGVLVCNHNSDVNGFDADGNPVTYNVYETDLETLRRVILAPDDPHGAQHVPTLSEALSLCYYTGMQINIDMKEGVLHAKEIAELVVSHGMRGRTVYATNGGGVDAIKAVLSVDPQARFIDTRDNFTREKLSSVPDYQSKCFVYTWDLSPECIEKIRESGCMLATISLNAGNVASAFIHHPDMAEYPHTSDFVALDREIIKNIEF